MNLQASLARSLLLTSPTLLLASCVSYAFTSAPALARPPTHSFVLSLPFCPNSYISGDHTARHGLPAGMQQPAYVPTKHVHFHLPQKPFPRYSSEEHDGIPTPSSISSALSHGPYASDDDDDDDGASISDDDAWSDRNDNSCDLYTALMLSHSDVSLDRPGLTSSASWRSDSSFSCRSDDSHSSQGSVTFTVTLEPGRKHLLAKTKTWHNAKMRISPPKVGADLSLDEKSALRQHMLMQRLNNSAAVQSSITAEFLAPWLMIPPLRLLPQQDGNCWPSGA